MGPHQQVRSSSQSNETRRSKDIELEDQLQDQEKSQTLAEEESERLLPGGGEVGDDDPQPKKFTAPRKPLSKRLRWALYGLAGVVLFTLLGVLAVRGSAAHVERKTVRTFRRPSAEYIVPGNWDYHAHPKARYQRWTITDITANPDGVFRPMTVINGKFPGPMITCNEGDTIVVDVINHSQNATSIHWHGLFQNGTNFMDGTPGVTQCPIAPGETFRYQFKVTGQAGSCKCASILRPVPPGWSSVLTRAKTSIMAIQVHKHWTGWSAPSSFCHPPRDSPRRTLMTQIVWSWSRTGTTIPRLACCDRLSHREMKAHRFRTGY